jgi:hypothetical protein
MFRDESESQFDRIRLLCDVDKKDQVISVMQI